MIAVMAIRLWRDIASCLSPHGYLWAGYPNYRRLFGRDSLISAWQLLDVRPEIAKATLLALAKHQGLHFDQRREEEPGKIPHEHYDGGFLQKVCDLAIVSAKWNTIRRYFSWRFPYYGSVDSTALWLILLGRYFKRTGDADLVHRLWPNAIMALHWIEFLGDIDHDCFIEYQRKSRHGLAHQGWKDGLLIDIEPPVAIVEAQGYYYAAYREIALLAHEVMRDVHAKIWYEKEAAILKQKFNAAFWMSEQGFFALALDGKKRQVPIITSNPGHLLFTGIVDRDKEAKLVKRLFSDDLWTPYGIRTHSVKDPDFDPVSYHQGSIWPHDNWIIYNGLQARGYHREARLIKKALIYAYNTLGCMPELYGVDENGRIFSIKNACSPQAWASGALLNFVTEGSGK